MPSTDPFVASSGPLTTGAKTNIGGTNYLTLTFNRSLAATDVTYTVQVSPDLVTWTNGSTYGPNGDSPATTETAEIIRSFGGTLETITVRDTMPMLPDKKHFMRLQVTR